jgi:hypothetical protein
MSSAVLIRKFERRAMEASAPRSRIVGCSMNLANRHKSPYHCAEDCLRRQFAQFGSFYLPCSPQEALSRVEIQGGLVEIAASRIAFVVLLGSTHAGFSRRSQASKELTDCGKIATVGADGKLFGLVPSSYGKRRRCVTHGVYGLRPTRAMIASRNTARSCATS